jgi:hypothetical protein
VLQVNDDDTYVFYRLARLLTRRLMRRLIPCRHAHRKRAPIVLVFDGSGSYPRGMIGWKCCGCGRLSVI